MATVCSLGVTFQRSTHEVHQRRLGSLPADWQELLRAVAQEFGTSPSAELVFTTANGEDLRGDNYQEHVRAGLQVSHSNYTITRLRLASPPDSTSNYTITHPSVSARSTSAWRSRARPYPCSTFGRAAAAAAAAAAASSHACSSSSTGECL
jgi:hypothetical protein